MAPWGAARPPGCLSSAQSWCPVRLCGFLGIASPLEEAEVLFQEARGGRRGGVGGGAEVRNRETTGKPQGGVPTCMCWVLGPLVRRGGDRPGLLGPAVLLEERLRNPFLTPVPGPACGARSRAARRCASAAANPQMCSTPREARPRPGPQHPGIAIMNLHVESVMSL